jgi:hypothetical protein
MKERVMTLATVRVIVTVLLFQFNVKSYEFEERQRFRLSSTLSPSEMHLLDDVFENPNDSVGRSPELQCDANPVPLEKYFNEIQPFTSKIITYRPIEPVIFVFLIQLALVKKHPSRSSDDHKIKF